MSNLTHFPKITRVCPEPVGLVTLYDMLRVYANSFVRAASLIGQLSAYVKSGVDPGASSWGELADALNDLREQCEGMHLPATKAQVQRIEYIFNAKPLNMTMFLGSLLELTSRLNDELAAYHLYSLNSAGAEYLTTNKFSQSMSSRFPDAIPDMDEAARCYAFERPTACIFHLMRVSEYE